MRNQQRFFIILLLIYLISFTPLFLSGCHDQRSLSVDPGSVAEGCEVEAASEKASLEKASLEGQAATARGPEQDASSKAPGSAGGREEEGKSPTGREESKEVSSTERFTYKPDFYAEPISEDLKKKISGVSYPENCSVPFGELRYLSVLHFDFDQQVQTGELICNREVAMDLLEIFYELYEAGYPIEQIRLIDEYGGDDILSMMDNNSSCFNYRPIAGTDKLSNHALGLAVDINPFFNPYVRFNGGAPVVSPETASYYADRQLDFLGKIDHDDLCYRLFTEHGFSWGGDWSSSKDYQHFEKIPAK